MEHLAQLSIVAPGKSEKGRMMNSPLRMNRQSAKYVFALVLMAFSVPTFCQAPVGYGTAKISGTSGFQPGVNSVILGGQVGAIGDLDGNGVNEIAVGRIDDHDGGSSAGAVQILFMNADDTVGSTQKISNLAGGISGLLDSGDRFGRSIVSLGDLNGDGVDDIAVGAYQDDDGGLNNGAVWILFMNSDGTVGSHQKISQGQGSFAGPLEFHAEFGSSIDTLGDLNNDGVVDLVVGAPEGFGSSHRGAVWVLFMQSNGHVASSVKIGSGVGGFAGALASGDRMGYSVANVGDVDGDGITDVAAGTPFDDDAGGESGSVWIIFLNADGTAKGQQKIGPLDGGFVGALDGNDRFGHNLIGLGDVDGDGIPDLCVGAPRDDDGGIDRGAIWKFYLNQNGTVRSHHKISHTTFQPGFYVGDNDYFGNSFGLLPDGRLVTVAPGDDDGATNSGAVWILETPLSFVNPANGHTYALTSQRFDVWEARQSAASYGGHLVAINNAAENSFLEANFNSETIYWTGLSDEKVEGVFVWDSGEPLQYVNWRGSSGEPNGGTGENHVLFWPGTNGEWSDWVGDASQSPGPAYGIVEIPLTPTTPVFSYHSKTGVTALDLSWIPDGGIVNSAAGTISCTGATPGAFGLIGVSLAQVDIPLGFGFPLLIANDPVNLLGTASFGFGFAGEFSASGVSRQNPFIAGSTIYIQLFETGPFFAGSNGLGMKVIP